jgi:hypothetical protein
MEAVEDIIRQSVSELRKRAFGEDADDVRSLSWSREQAWAVFRALASRDTVPYYETLMNVPFKGDEGPLRGMEQAELITVEVQDGRPSAIRPGRPIYRYVFRRLVNGMCNSVHSCFLRTSSCLLLKTQTPFLGRLRTLRLMQSLLRVLRQPCAHASRNCRCCERLGLTRDIGGVAQPRQEYGKSTCRRGWEVRRQRCRSWRNRTES